MIIFNNTIFIQFQKSGGTHIELILDNLYEIKKFKKHTSLIDAKKYVPIDNFKIFSGIRNPLDWYVSLWAYGCSKRGYLYSLLTKDKPLSTYFKYPRYFIYSFDRKFWKKLYSDVQNIDNFRLWITNILLGNSRYNILEYPIFFDTVVR